MKLPKILDVDVKENLILSVKFTDGQVRQYDCNQILNRNEEYAKLSDFNFFKNVTVDAGGHGLSWNDYVDISEFEILENS